ncbi:MAG: sigma-54-dependent transcriptional regulator [Candidatus Acidulodesulfobacterium sp.]
MKNNQRILIVDDEKSILESLSILLVMDGYDVVTAQSANAAVKLLKNQVFNLIISDVRMPEMSGMDLIKLIKREYKESASSYGKIPVILMTAYSDVKIGIEAIKMGAFDYLTKPLDNEELKIVIKNALDYFSVLDELNALKKTEFLRGGIIGSSKAINSVLNDLNRVSKGFTTILLTGESGTGKELAARLIYEIYSKNYIDSKKIPFVPVNIAAIPDNLVESELFGYTKGTFTGAENDKTGLIKYADGGILFLDEIGDLPMQVQVKLLRILQEKTYRKLGSNKEEPLNVKIIAATNKDLAALISEGKFREDLYYRLNKINITMPPLREHKEDLPELIAYFIKKYSKSIVSVSQEVLAILTEYDYPGNIRELENIIERACIYCGGSNAGEEPLLNKDKEIVLDCLPDYILEKNKHDRKENLSSAAYKNIPDTDIRKTDDIDIDYYMADIAGIFEKLNKKYGKMTLSDFIKEIEKYIVTDMIKKENSKLEAAKTLGLSLRSLRYILSKCDNGR